MLNLLKTISFLLLISISSHLEAQSDRYLHFDGNNDFAELPNASQYFTGASGISLTGWFCSDGLGYGHGYFGFRGPGNGQGQMYVIELGTGRLECRYISTAGFNEYVSPNNTVQPQEWQHVAWTFTGSTTSLYINGEFVGSTPSNGTFTSTTRSFGIGKSIENGFNFVFGGRIDEVSVWRKGLTQLEILDIMANELVGNEPDLELYYKMNQGIPGGNNTGITQLVSEVGGGTRDANLINFAMNGATSNFNVSALDPGFQVTDFCAGAPNAAIITGLAGGTFTFNNPPSDFATIDPVTGTITGGVAGTTYDIRYTTPGDCAPHQIHTVTVLAEEDPTFTLTDFCAGGLNAASAIATPGGTFSFSPDLLDGSTIDPITGQISDAVTGATYTVEYLTTGVCSASSTENVNVYGSPAIIDIAQECAPDELTYTITFDITGGDPSTYLVTGDGVLTGNTFVSDPIPSGDTYAFTVSDANACGFDLAEGLVTCACPADATFSGDVVTCEGIDGEIEITLIGAAPWSIAYEIDGVPQPLIISPTNLIILPVSVSGSYQFTSVTDFNCTSDISDSDPVMVEILPAPTATIAGNEEICAGESIDFEVVLTGAGPWDMTYAIDGINQPPVVVNASPYLLNATLEGEYTIELLTDAQCSGSGLGQGVLTVNPLPTALINGDEYFCTGESASIEIALTGSPDFQVTYTIDGNLQTALDIAGGTSYTLTTNQTGTYDLIGISDANCAGTVTGSVIITEEALPIAILQAGDYTICEGSTQQVNIDLNGSADWSVTYTIDGVLQAPLTSATSPLAFNVNMDGTYELVSVSDNLCTNTTGTEQVNIAYFPPIGINYSEDVSVCIGDVAGVWANAYGGQGNVYTYTWDETDLVSNFNNQANYAPSQTGNVMLSVNEACDYNQSFSIPIEVNQLPPISITGEFVNCGEGLIQLNNSTPANYVGNDCTWLIDGLEIQTCGNVSQYFELGSYDVGLSMTSPDGCFNEVFMEDLVQVNPSSEASFIYSPAEVTTTESQVWFSNGSNNADQYYWTFGSEGFSQEENPIFDFGTQQGVYPVCLIAENGFGCIDTICETIRLTNELLVLIPNSFTPDDDGVNDYFFPILNGIDENDYRFSIFDRFGSLVFETYDIEDRWNGSYREVLNYYSADGWYTWKLVVKELGSTDKQEFVGTVLMVR